MKFLLALISLISILYLYSCSSYNREQCIQEALHPNKIDKINIDNNILKDTATLNLISELLKNAKRVDLEYVRLAVYKQYKVQIYYENKVTASFDIIMTRNYGFVIVLWGPPKIFGFRRLLGYYKCPGLSDFIKEFNSNL
jgi:hypothetical protein